MALMKMRGELKKSPGAREFKKPASSGRALLFAVLAAALCAVAIWIYVAGNVWFAALVIIFAAISLALSIDNWRRLRSQQDAG